MTIAFHVYNEVENATLTASSENASFPLSNLLDPRRTKTFRSTTNSDWVKMDFGTIRPVDSVFFVDHTLNGFNVTTITVQFNVTDSWTSPPLSVSMTIDAANGYAYANFAQGNYRYCRIVMTSTGSFCEIAKVFVGARNQYPQSDFNYPLTTNLDNLATVSKNRYGQKFIDEIANQKTVSGSIEYIAPEDIDEFLDFLEYVSITKPFYLYFDTTVNGLPRLNGYYYLKSEPSPRLQAGNYWTLSLSLEEAM